MVSTAAAAAVPPRTVRLAGRAYPVVLPSWGDPRLHVALVIGTLQVLGQAALGFEVSVAQILACLGICAAVEVGVALWRDRVLLWPASALLTGNSVALLLRTAGTRHGDWWSLDGIGIFAAACLLSMGSKHLLRHRGRHVFNPSNLGLVAAFTLFGTQRVNPQDLWWGALSPGLWATLAVLVLGGLLVTRRLRMLGMAIAFWAAFALSTGVVAASGHCVTARWHYGAVCGYQYWSVMATSPELLVFLFFMITDPRTAPAGRAARIAFGAGVGFLAALLAAPMQTEFATKVAVLGALVIVCALTPLAPLFSRAWRRIPRGALYGVAALGAGAGALLAASIPARTASLPAAALPHAVAAVDATLPPIEVTTSAALATGGIDAATARAMVAATLAHLDATGARLRATSAVVLLVRDPARPQDSPRLGVEIRGTTARGASFRSDYVLAAVDGRWIITSEHPAA